MILYRQFTVGLISVILATGAFAQGVAQDKRHEMAKARQIAAIQKQASHINLNTANVKELMKVKGINNQRAQAILNHRKKNGDFKNVQELSNVKGFNQMNPSKLEEIQNAVTVD